MMNTERRFSNLTLRSEEISGKRFIGGYAATFDDLSLDLGGFREKLARGCFARSLRTGDPRALLDHDSGRLLGRKSAGTLDIYEDERGLRFRCELPDTSAGRDTYESVRRGDLTGMSFGFIAKASSWDNQTDPDDPEEICTIRTVTDAELLEVSAVAFPAYLSSSVSASERSAALFPGGEMPAEIRSHIGPDAARRRYANRRMTELAAEMEKDPIFRAQNTALQLSLKRALL